MPPDVEEKIHAGNILAGMPQGNKLQRAISGQVRQGTPADERRQRRFVDAQGFVPLGHPPGARERLTAVRVIS